MNSPYQPARRSPRYHLHLPVSVKVADREIQARSENLSLHGILLTSAYLIPVGSSVELTVGARQLSDNRVPLTARGKVLRVQPQAAGNFAVAIECDRPFGRRWWNS
jgi:hypothetical protein